MALTLPSHRIIIISFVVGTLKIQFVNDFELHDTVSLTIVAILHMTSTDLIHLLTVRLFPPAHIFPVPHLPVPVNHRSTLFL